MHNCPEETWRHRDTDQSHRHSYKEPLVHVLLSPAPKHPAEQIILMGIQVILKACQEGTKPSEL